MKKVVFLILAAALVWRADAADTVWLTDLSQAEARAKTENKVVLMEFTGSDWCPACILLKKKVLSTKTFKSYAAANFVLLELDYPQDHPQPDALKKASQELLAKYNTDGVFPLIVLLDANGKEIARNVGYDGSSPKAFIAMLDKLKTGK